jgi:nitroreductase
MTFKRIIKMFMPRILIDLILSIKERREVNRAFRKDKDAYLQSAFTIRKTKNQENYEAMMIYYYHPIEKGLSNNNFRLGFGRDTYTNLIHTMSEYKKREYDLNIDSYQTGLSVLSEYISKHEGSGVDVSFIVKSLEKLQSKIAVNKHGGTLRHKKVTLLQKSKGDFFAMSQNRFSVRQFSKQKIDINQIKRALKLAEKTPSLCNRQPWKTYIVSNKSIISELAHVQGGLRGFGQNMDKLLVITANNHYLKNYTERNDGFIAGGLYSMTLLYSLQYYGIATCPLSAALTNENDLKVRSILNVPQNENMILFIGIGEYLDEFETPKSHRSDFTNKSVFIS